MNRLAGLILGVTVVILELPPLFAAELTANLIRDGGMEEWQTTGPQDGGWSYLTVSCKGTEFGRDEKGNVHTPVIFSQAYDTRVMKPETGDVHGGKKALRLKGQFYLGNSTVANAFNTHDGDVYVVRYWIKGAGQTRLYLHVYGDAIAQFLEEKGKPEKDRWTLIEERIQIVGPTPTTIYPRLWCSEEMLIDDVSVARVIYESERPLLPIPADCQERVAFAAETEGKIVLDGKLDEPAWSKAIPFGGFRSLGDQNCLAASQPSFRVLFDEQNLYFGLAIPLANARQVLDELKSLPLLDKSGKPLPKTDNYTSRESIELFLQAPGRSGYRQLAVSLDGYRYDGSGAEGAWNGNWEFAVDAGADGWSLEIRIPAADLDLVKIAPAEGWRLNLCCNQPTGVSTWSAVGNAFHNPALFGKLVAQDFEKWQTQQPVIRTQKKAEILQAAGPHAAGYSDRLAAADAFLPATAAGNGTVRDWQAVTRVYAQLNYTSYTYRCAEADVHFLNFFRQGDPK